MFFPGSLSCCSNLNVNVSHKSIWWHHHHHHRRHHHVFFIKLKLPDERYLPRLLDLVRGRPGLLQIKWVDHISSKVQLRFSSIRNYLQGDSSFSSRSKPDMKLFNQLFWVSWVLELFTKKKIITKKYENTCNERDNFWYQSLWDNCQEHSQF